MDPCDKLPQIETGASSPAPKPVLEACLRRVRSWRVPPNWSLAAWSEEIEEVQTIAAWQAASDYDPSAGTAFETFVYQRVMARSLTRYRQEWTYALHFVSDQYVSGVTFLDDSDGCDLPSSDISSDPIAVYAELHEGLTRLCQADRQIIEFLFWNGLTESQIARELNVNQSTVNRRKFAAFRRLSALIRA